MEHHFLMKFKGSVNQEFLLNQASPSSIKAMEKIVLKMQGPKELSTNQEYLWNEDEFHPTKR